MLCLYNIKIKWKKTQGLSMFMLYHAHMWGRIEITKYDLKCFDASIDERKVLEENVKFLTVSSLPQLKPK